MIIKEIYKTLKKFGFTERKQDVKNNKRLEINKTFDDKEGRYVEIYDETRGYAVIIYGKGFTERPYREDIYDKEELIKLQKKLTSVII